MPVDPATIALALRAFEMASDLAMRAAKTRAEMRKIAEQVGVSPADLDTADERFQRRYEDPLAASENEA